MFYFPSRVVGLDHDCRVRAKIGPLTSDMVVKFSARKELGTERANCVGVATVRMIFDQSHGVGLP